MAYIPHTGEDVAAMLAAIGAPTVDALFASVPASLRLTAPLDLPAGLSEADTARTVRDLLARNRLPRLSFAGAGAYEHYIPAAVRPILSRGEFLTSYTPYQPEASQGSLQAFFEFQTIIARLTGLEVANASLYEAGSALAEAALMAHRSAPRPRILVNAGLHPLYRRVLETHMAFLGVTVETLPEQDGVTDAAAARFGPDVCAVALQHPNIFGALEPVHALAAAAKAAGAQVIGVVNPVSLGLLSPPGAWGADIAVGDCQPIGVPVAFGGPYAGFIACRKDLVRKLPGRIVGATVDGKGRRGFVLTLQAREQHIRREKATSNICTNQALVALSFTIAASLLGGRGLRAVAEACAARAHTAARRLAGIPGVRLASAAPFFHEFVVTLPRDAVAVCRAAMDRDGIVPGVPLSRLMAGRDRDLLVCVTETKQAADLEALAIALERAVAAPAAATGGARH